MKIWTIIISILFITNSFPQKLYSDTTCIVSSEFIYHKNDLPFPSCHASTIAETPDGLIAAWFAGTHENHPDVGIWLSRNIYGKWTKPVQVADGIQNENLRYATWNPVLFYNYKTTLLFYKVGPNPASWWGEFISSNDNGKTWFAPTKLPKNILGPIKNKPILMSNGELLCPSSAENNGWRVHIEFTSDMGLTWQRTEALNGNDSVSAIQPTILLHPDDKLQMLCRTKNGKIYTAWSTDKGRTWTKLTPTVLPSNNSGIDAVIMKDGRLLLVYNHINNTNRNILNVAISQDGINWEAAVILENDSNMSHEYSYPAVIQSKDEMIHITYTWRRELIKHVVIDPSMIKTKSMIEGIWPVTTK